METPGRTPGMTLLAAQTSCHCSSTEAEHWPRENCVVVAQWLERRRKLMVRNLMRKSVFPFPCPWTEDSLLQSVLRCRKLYTSLCCPVGLWGLCSGRNLSHWCVNGFLCLFLLGRSMSRHGSNRIQNLFLYYLFPLWPFRFL